MTDPEPDTIEQVAQDLSNAIAHHLRGAPFVFITQMPNPKGGFSTFHLSNLDPEIIPLFIACAMHKCETDGEAQTIQIQQGQ